MQLNQIRCFNFDILLKIVKLLEKSCQKKIEESDLIDFMAINRYLQTTNPK